MSKHLDVRSVTIKTRTVQEAILRLTMMLNWSDRIGSDEIFELEEIIKLLINEPS